MRTRASTFLVIAAVLFFCGAILHWVTAGWDASIALRLVTCVLLLLCAKAFSRIDEGEK